jgi:hypothetical protein
MYEQADRNIKQADRQPGKTEDLVKTKGTNRHTEILNRQPGKTKDLVHGEGTNRQTDRSV